MIKYIFLKGGKSEGKKETIVKLISLYHIK